MKFFLKAAVISSSILASASITTATYAINCPFDAKKGCTLSRNILTDRAPDGLKYYGATNYDHRFSGEINIFDANLVQSYIDPANEPGQLKLTANRVGGNFFKSGEIMTRVDLDKIPYKSPTKIHPFTTSDIKHGYLEVKIKLPKCDVSDDGLCQRGTNPTSYNRGLWPSVWLLPTSDTNWPQNGEIDIWEAYQLGRDFNVTTATLHFNGNSGSCGGGDCKFIGYHLAVPAASGPLYNAFHTWGFEWQPDPSSTKGGVIMTGYFDNNKIWGPLKTDSLPVDGPNAFSRGFHDPVGGFYVIAALAIGGPYAGAPNSHLQSTSMYVQSIKAYSVETTPTNQCFPPANIKSTYTADKKQITLSWDKPFDSKPIENFQVNDWLNRIIWKSASGNIRTFTDKTLPGTAGTFTYYLYSNCTTGQSVSVKYDAIIK